MPNSSKPGATRPLRVLRIVTLGSASGRYGGPYDTARRQGELARQNGIEYELLAGHLPNDAPNHEHVTTVPVRRWLPLKDHLALMSVRLMRRQVKLIQQADVVHVSLSRELIPVLTTLCAILFRRPLIVQPHGMLTARTSALHRRMDPLMRAMARRARIIIALTSREEHELRLWLRDSGHAPINVIGNPSPKLTRLDVEGGSPVALFAARLHPRKRVSDFLAAAALAFQRGDAVSYVIAGPDQGDLQLVKEGTRALPNLSYVGALSQQQLNDALARSSVFVLPATDEPWGNVVATAIKAQIPVVVTESAALADDVRNLQLGAVVADRSPAALREAIRLLATSREPEAPHLSDAVNARFGNDAIGATLTDTYRACS